MCIAKAPLLFRLSSNGAVGIEKFAFVHCREVANAVSVVGREHGCVCLRWEIANEYHRILDIAQSLRGTLVEERKYYGLLPLSSIVSTVNVLRPNLGV